MTSLCGNRSPAVTVATLATMASSAPVMGCQACVGPATTAVYMPVAFGWKKEVSIGVFLTALMFFLCSRLSV
ncbi:hypothetical protein EDD22DRAFT_879774 [Suillus occidentalis]|nr:hypothetical protein EDD22DRAFT_879774 [Suillus occidentalis]